MTEWIDFYLYAALMALLWFGLPAVSAGFVLPSVEDRNPGWLAAHPSTARQLARTAGFRWSGRVLGGLAIALLASVQLGFRPEALAASHFEAARWMLLRDLSTALAVLWLVWFGGCSAGFAWWLRRNVALAARRRASLEPRSLEAFVPPALSAAVYLAVGLHLAAWMAAGALGAGSGPAFRADAAFQFAIAAILFLMARAVAYRRPNALDRIFGRRFRGTEVRWAFAAQLLALPNGLARLYEHAAGTPIPAVDRAAHLALILFMVAALAAGLFRYAWGSGGAGNGAADAPRPA